MAIKLKKCRKIHNENEPESLQLGTQLTVLRNNNANILTCSGCNVYPVHAVMPIMLKTESAEEADGNVIIPAGIVGRKI